VDANNCTETRQLEKDEVWQSVQRARHPKRPKALQFIESFKDFDQLHGDRMFGDCQAIIGGTALFDDTAVMVLGQEKGHDTQTRIKHNFGMPRPEGYRKASRLFTLAEQYQMPVVIFLDSPGAYAGVDAEQRNQSQAIAHNILQMTSLRVPIIAFIIGEAMSGGAMAMGVTDHIAMYENSIFSVISPEGCSGILWKDKDHSIDAAHAMAVHASAMAKGGFVDELISEPGLGAHTNPQAAIDAMQVSLRNALNSLIDLDIDELIQRRHARLQKLSSSFSCQS